jgi:hypothetical protein
MPPTREATTGNPVDRFDERVAERLVVRRLDVGIGRAQQPRGLHRRAVKNHRVLHAHRRNEAPRGRAGVERARHIGADEHEDPVRVPDALPRRQ